jgi:hypothetical protein
MLVLIAAALAVAASGCGQPPDDSPQLQIQEQLVGTWLRDYTEGSTHVRRVLVLEPGGDFRELASVHGAGSPEEFRHSGKWTYDGTNLKRRYTLMNGRQPSAPTVPFATFEVHFDTPGEFTAIDHVHHREVVYQRVAEGTLP